ncbi:MAG: hypothetical protein K0S34_1527 [Bacillales bacterium]|jgi:uncharacterized protein (TIGR01440 family)|nr:hypothetical protein [Bacillales bacterium]
MIETIHEEWKLLLREFSNEVLLDESKVLIIGCSTSEVLGHKIGTNSTLDAAKVIYKELRSFQKKLNFHLAVQCCEHLNRALVVEREFAINKNLEIVNAIPSPKAGGAFATVVYHNMRDPVLVESIRADVGIDIGDTLIGMHIKNVAIPIRLSINSLGHSHVNFATTRPKYIGGSRTQYEQINKIDYHCE